MTHQKLEIKGLKEENALLRHALASYEKAGGERRIIEEKYKQSKIRFQTIFEKSQLGNKILASDLSIIEVNEALVSMLGYASKNDLINRKILEFAHSDFINHWHELQTALWDKRIPSFSLETCLVKKDKSTIWCRVTSILFDDDDKSLGYTIIENINEKKVLEEKAQRLYENQEMMMYMVAHDLKSPVHIIQSLSGIIRKNIENHQLDKSITHLSMLDHTCNRSYSIINDLMLIGELESEQIETEVVNITEILRSLIDNFSTVSDEKSIQLITPFIQSEVLANVNKQKITRAIENLLSNAIKFSNSGGRVKVDLIQEGSRLLLKIQDEGIGIPSTLQRTVFNKFTKAKRKGTQGEATTGLGLFITKRIVEKHKGKVWFESRQNEGTTFFIRLPLSHFRNS